jgi:phytol kinase
MIHPLLGMALMLAALLLWMAALRVFQALVGPHPEVVRKLMHVGMGLTVLALPWLFDSAWSVLVLIALALVLLAAVRLVSGLRSKLGSVLGGVARKSLGEFYFGVSVAALFILSRGQPYANILYCVPILVLTLADAVAALIGVSYGYLKYETVDGTKSAEGSTAFFLAAFFSVHVPLLLATDMGRAETLLIALIVGFLIMLFEAIAWRGLDNLFIPLVCFLVLKIYLGPPALEVWALVTRLVVLLALFLFLLVWRSQATLDASGLLAGALVGYLAWALGDWRWLLFPLVLFFTYTLLSPRTPYNSRRIHNVHGVMSVCGAGLAWLFLARTFNQPGLLLPYTIAFAANLAIIGLARLRYDYPRLATPTLLTICIAQAWLLLFVPFAVIHLFVPFVVTQGAPPSALACALVALAGVAGASLLFYTTQPGMNDCPTDTPRWLRQAAASALGSAVGLVPLYLF